MVTNATDRYQWPPILVAHGRSSNTRSVKIPRNHRSKIRRQLAINNLRQNVRMQKKDMSTNREKMCSKPTLDCTTCVEHLNFILFGGAPGPPTSFSEPDQTNNRTNRPACLFRSQIEGKNMSKKLNTFVIQILAE